jgi:hypothetical protein
VIVLLVLGVGLVLFGAFVLLRYPSSTGGTVSIVGIQVSSAGAGLPLIVLGVAAVLLSNTGVAERLELPGLGRTESVTTSGDGASCFPDVASDRIRRLEAGASDQDVIGPHQSKAEPFVLVLTEGGATIAELRLRFFPENELFRVESAVDAECEELGGLSNLDRGGEPRVLQNFDTLGIRTATGDYALRLGGGTTIRVNVSRFVP